MNRLDDRQLRDRCRREIAAGENHTNLSFRLVAEGYGVDTKRLRRIWVEEGGYVRPLQRLYAPGCGPCDL